MKILLLSSLYPGPEIRKDFTPVVHDFAKKWIQSNHSVIVIHNLAYYNNFFHLLASLFGNIISNITGTYIPKKRLSKKIEYEIDGVKVLRSPLFKHIPYSKFNKETLNKQSEEIYAYIEKINFKPDLIVGHWGNPQFMLIKSIKIKYPESKSVLVLHNNWKKLYKTYGKNFKLNLKHIDFLGFRNQNNMVQFLKNNKFLGKTFLCYSGVSDEFINMKARKVNSDFSKFLFVGALIKRKYPAYLIEPLFNVFKYHFELSYIGTGNEIKNIQAEIEKHELDKVKILGRLSAELVRKAMDESDCFIMISKNEAFGLVYLEAMSRDVSPFVLKMRG